jgi:hypothetical protein
MESAANFCDTSDSESAAVTTTLMKVMHTTAKSTYKRLKVFIT